MKNLESKHLLLRKFELSDANDMYQNWANDSEVTRYLTWLPHKNVNETAELLKIWCDDYDKPNNYNWAVVLNNTGELIGNVSVVRIDKNDSKCCDFGFCFSRKYWGNGIATQTLQIIFNYLFNEVGFDKINGYNNVENKASAKVMQKLMMSYDSVDNNTCTNNVGEFVSADHYTITKEQFNSVTVRKAYADEVDKVFDIYEGIITHLMSTTNFCGWIHGIYPTLDVAQKAFDKGELFVAIQSGEVIGSCVLNHEQAKQYLEIDWTINDDKPLVVHTVAINPKNLRQGVAHVLLEFAKVYAKEHDILTIRLDASEPNIPARKIYEDVGFIKRGEMDLQTNRCGINNWFGYEFIIKKEK